MSTSTKKRTWIEMMGEEEQERVRINRQKVNTGKERVETLYETLQKIMEIRRFLNSIEEYYLEDGEIL